MANKSSNKKTQPLHPEYNKKQQMLANRQNKQRKIVRNRLYVMFAAFVIVIGLLSYSLHQQKETLSEKRQEEVAVKKELKQQQQQKKELQTEIKQLNDDEYISQLAREKLFLSKKGEIIFSLPDEDDVEDKKEDSKK